VAWAAAKLGLGSCAGHLAASALRGLRWRHGANGARVSAPSVPGAAPPHADQRAPHTLAAADGRKAMPALSVEHASRPKACGTCGVRPLLDVGDQLSVALSCLEPNDLMGNRCG
jgi:hypothetical protein